MGITILIGIVAVFLISALYANATANSANLKGHPVAYLIAPLKASTTFKRGGHVMTVGGYLLPCGDTALGIYKGRFFDADVTTPAVDGTLSGKVSPVGIEDRYQEFVAAAADATWIGFLAAFSNDYTVVQNASSTNHVIAGRIVQVLSATAVLVDTLDRFPGNGATQ